MHGTMTGMVYEITSKGPWPVEGDQMSVRVPCDGGGALFMFIVRKNAWTTIGGCRNVGWVVNKC
jgi:hypothetical protein